MGTLTEKLTDTRTRLGEQGGAFIKQTVEAGNELVSRTKEAGESFVHDTFGAGESFFATTREAGGDLIEVLQSEAEVWVELLRSEGLMGRDLRLHVSAEELERRLLELVREALTAVGAQVELVLETQVEARLKETKAPKAKSNGAAKAKSNGGAKAKSNGALKPPFRGYEDMSARDVVARLGRVTDDKAEAVLAYERSHKNRATIVRAAEHRIAAN